MNFALTRCLKLEYSCLRDCATSYAIMVACACANSPNKLEGVVSLVVAPSSASRAIAVSQAFLESMLHSLQCGSRTSEIRGRMLELKRRSFRLPCRTCLDNERSIADLENTPKESRLPANSITPRMSIAPELALYADAPQ